MLMLPLTWGQQMCLTMEREVISTNPRVRSNSAILFDKISTSDTATISQSLVDVSLANTTGEIKIKPVLERVCTSEMAHPGVGPDFSRTCEDSGAQFFYLSVKASRHPRDPSYCPRTAQLFLLVNGKVPLRGLVTQYKMYGGGIEVERAHRVVGLATDSVGR